MQIETEMFEFNTVIVCTNYNMFKVIKCNMYLKSRSARKINISVCLFFV